MRKRAMSQIQPIKYILIMKNIKTFNLILIVSSIFLALSCGKKAEFEVKDFTPLGNFKTTNDTLILQMDLSSAIDQGVIIPSKSADQENGFFQFTFSIRNLSEGPKKYCYKLFYQNESYKFNELRISGRDTTYNYLSSENFYGSWENANEEFHQTTEIAADGEFHLVTDSFRIKGNPRDEKRFFGGQPSNKLVTQEAITQKVNDIKNNAEWYAQICQKAKDNNVETEKQLRLDAFWCAKQDLVGGNENNRWKRNPRVGNYSFMLIVTTEEHLPQIPTSVKRIDSAEASGFYINPYSYLLAHENNEELGISVVRSRQVLKTKVAFDVRKGVYINLNEFKGDNLNTEYFRSNCGNSDELFKSAHFEQYFHNINKNFILHSIPIAADIMEEDYDKLDYNRNLKKFTEEELINDYIKVSDCPCKTIGYDSVRQSITITNPGNTTKPYRKENVGIKTRIGFTYGKYIAKIRFPKILNKSNVWNGLTCAYWLVNQDESEWNNRRSCYKKGYIPRSIVGRTEERLKDYYYSEIDIEIAKDSRYWPKTSYEGGKVPGDDNAAYNHNLIAACTNWDLACNDPECFDVGVLPFKYENEEFMIHRWDHWYKALTSKHEIPHDSIVGGDIYFEIEWKPNEIIYRVGRTKGRMITIGYMNNTVTAIPNNQMLIVITQEFHLGEWWPTSPFQQNYIPFFKNDVTGEILELEIE